jgi:hypothetical protein
VTRRLGDRRVHPRYEVAGDLAASFETQELLQVVNIAPGGALLQSSHYVPPGAECRAQLVVDGEELDLRVRVCRVHETPPSPPASPPSFLLGVEFVYVSLPLLLERLIAVAASPDRV